MRGIKTSVEHSRQDVPMNETHKNTPTKRGGKKGKKSN